MKDVDAKIATRSSGIGVNRRKDAKTNSNPSRPSSPQPDIINPPSINRSRLLNRVVAYYHKTFSEDPRAREYLKSRGIAGNTVYLDFTVGYSNGTLFNMVPDKGDVHDALMDVGILTETGLELFYGCAVFPVFDENKDCVDLYGCRITGSYPEYVYLPGCRRGVMNFQAAKRSKSVILAGSILDALTLYNAGFRDVIPIGDGGLTRDLIDLITRSRLNEIYICLDGDHESGEAVDKIAGQLQENGVDSYIVKLPEFKLPSANDKRDINTFFLVTPGAPAAFERLLKDANPRASLQSDKSEKDEHQSYEKTDTGFAVRYGVRFYELRTIAREGGRLKATIKAVKGQAGNKAPRFHLDTVDLYSNRSRLFFAKACAVLFPSKPEIIMEDLSRLIGLAESWQPEDRATTCLPKMTKKEEDDAMEFLKDPEIFARILADFESIGITGENANKLMGYLSATSRMLEEPLSVLVQSRSAAGKSTLQDAVLSLMPPEDYIKYTRLTGQALFYKEEDSLAHKLIAIEEEQGAREATYSIRSIQSSKYLSIAATEKDSSTGRIRTAEYKVKGPVALMITTTEAEPDYETSNRFIMLTIDESQEMTERILQRQRESETLAGLIGRTGAEQVTRRHHNAQRLLRHLSVINPFASHLTFPAQSLQARRDHKKYLGLIKAIAFLHQYQREIKTVNKNGQAIQYIEVTLDDIEKANGLAAEILGRTLDELSPPSRLLLAMIRDNVLAECQRQAIEPGAYRFRRKDIRGWTKWSDSQIKRHVRQLEDLEYLYSVQGKKGKEYVYELLYPGGGEDGKPFLMGLTGVKEIKKKIKAQDGKKGGLDPTWTPLVRR